jgi:5'-nucleotidase
MQETNLGNFIMDIVLSAVDADAAVINSSALRSNMVHPRGDFRNRDLMKILPFVNKVVVLEMTGAKLLEALEHGVSMTPEQTQCFPQVSICYCFGTLDQSSSICM